MLTIVINILGVLLLGFVIWWFWLSQRKQVVKVQDNVIEIKVADGMYSPDQIEVSQGHVIHLRFLRSDPSPCAQTVIFSALNRSAELPVNKPVDLQLQIEQPGEYEFTCQMGMYRGKLIVR